jgi:hypothetical protein
MKRDGHELRVNCTKWFTNVNSSNIAANVSLNGSFAGHNEKIARIRCFF